VVGQFIREGRKSAWGGLRRGTGSGWKSFGRGSFRWVEDAPDEIWRRRPVGRIVEVEGLSRRRGGGSGDDDRGWVSVFRFERRSSRHQQDSERSRWRKQQPKILRTSTSYNILTSSYTNPRGIPRAPFVGKVEEFVTSSEDINVTLRKFDEMLSYPILRN
jgi:hypothetical protein